MILLNKYEDLSIEKKMLTGLCLIFGIIFLIYQMKKTKQMKKSKDEINKSYQDYSYRELFHFFIQPEYHFDKIHLAKEFSEEMHFEASKYMMIDHPNDPDFADHFTYMKYNKEKINERLNYISQKLLEERYLHWYDAGRPVSGDTRYWWAQTKSHLLNYLIQREPYHLTDGCWLRGVPQGPMSLIQSKLFSIYIDELGNGDVNQNHPNVYLNILKNLSLHIPPITSKEFIEQKQLFDISFKKPLLTLTTSLFPKTYEPEILGYTLWLETTSASEHLPLRKILERYHIDANFSLLHTAIDNNLNGHGKYARDAVQQYLDHIQQTQGDQAVEEHWKRIWIGYVAYGTTGNIDETLKEFFKKQNQSKAQEEFIELMKRKGPLAEKMHGSRRIGSKEKSLNEMFLSKDFEKISNELANSDLIVKGEPGKSPFLNHVVTFNGPMYQVFNADELIIIARWIISLSPTTVNQMISIVLKRQKLAKDISSDIQLKLSDGSNKSLKDLFQGQPNELLSAFRASQWTIPFDGEKVREDNVEKCPLMKSIYSNGILENVFDRFSEDEEILRQWILDGSPLPNETFQTKTNHFQIFSHENFQFNY